MQSPGEILWGRGCVSPGQPSCPQDPNPPVGRTHYGGHGGPWQGSWEAGGLVPTAQLRSSSSSPDSREMQRKTGRQTPERDKREARGGRIARHPVSVGSQALKSDSAQSQGVDPQPRVWGQECQAGHLG